MEFRLLGVLEVVGSSGEVVELRGPKLRALAALLALHAGRVVSADRLIDALYGDDVPQRADNALHLLVSKLRRALREAGEGDVLLTRNPGYVLEVEPQSVDSVRFADLEAEGRVLLEQGDAAGAAACLGRALGLWRGEALAEFAFEEFASAERGRLAELRLAALEARIDADLALGRHLRCVGELEALVAAQPLRERLWALLMVGLYRSGRQADALRAYQDARRHLDGELGLEPGPELRELEAAVLAQDPSVAWQPPAASEDSDPGAGRLTLAGPTPSASSGRDLVGRGPELSRLEEAMATAVGGRGRVVLVTGEPGIGKSRLVEELVDQARGGGLCSAWGGSVEGGGTPAYWPWVGVVRALLASVEPRALAEAIGAGAGELAQVVPEIKEVTGPLDAPAALDPETARMRLFEAVVGMLRGLARHRPLVVVLDDLQWADVASLQLLAFLAGRLADSSVLLVGTYRPAEVGPDHPLADTLAALARHQVVERVELGGLDEAEVGRLLAATAGGERDAAVVAAVAERTGGNPFFVSELARLLRADLDLRTVPAGVRDVVRRNLRRVPEPTLDLLRMAALVGRDFELEVVREAADLDAEQALELVEAAVSAGLVGEDPLVVGRLRFSHDLVRETIVGELTALRRTRLHARLGEALESLHGADDRRAVALAHHWFAALPAAPAEKAIASALAAAEAETGRLAYEQAEEQLRRALAVARTLPPRPGGHRRELDVLLQLGPLLTMTRGYTAPDLGEVLSRARELGLELGTGRDVVPVLFGLVGFLIVGGECAGARRMADEMMRVATGSNQWPELVTAHLAVGITEMHLGHLTSARLHLAEAVALQEGLEDPWFMRAFALHPPVASHSFLAWATWFVDGDGPAREIALEARRLTAPGCTPLTTVHALLFLTWVSMLNEDVPTAARWSAEVVEVSRAKGVGLYLSMGALCAGWVCTRNGAIEEGIAQMTGALAGMEAAGALVAHSWYYGLLAEAERAAGRPAAALAWVDQALGFVERTGERFWEPELHRLRGELLLVVSPERRVEAVAEMGVALALAEEQGSRTLARRAAASRQRAEGVDFPGELVS